MGNEHYKLVLELAADIEHIFNLSIRKAQNEKAGVEIEEGVLDEVNYWGQIFRSTDPKVYEDVLKEFRYDAERERIIKGLIDAYNKISNSFKLDYRAIYDLLNNYWHRIQEEEKEKEKKKWTGNKKRFLLLINDRFKNNTQEIESLHSFVEKIYNEYEFEYAWDLRKCYHYYQKEYSGR